MPFWDVIISTGTDPFANMTVVTDTSPPGVL